MIEKACLADSVLLPMELCEPSSSDLLMMLSTAWGTKERSSEGNPTDTHSLLHFHYNVCCLSHCLLATAPVASSM